MMPAYIYSPVLGILFIHYKSQNLLQTIRDRASESYGCVKPYCMGGCGLNYSGTVVTPVSKEMDYFVCTSCSINCETGICITDKNLEKRGLTRYPTDHAFAWAEEQFNKENWDTIRKTVAEIWSENAKSVLAPVSGWNIPVFNKRDIEFVMTQFLEIAQKKKKRKK